MGTRVITADELETADSPPDGTLEGGELGKVFWRIKGREKERARREAFWSATNEALSQAYRELETATAALADARAQLLALNHQLEGRVAGQVEKIVAHAREIDALNARLRVQVQDRSRELAATLRRLSGDVPGRLPPGTELGGRVRILRLLGSGGVGEVHLADDLVTGERVAVKLLRPGVARDAAAIHRFLTEAEAAASVDHPAIVKTLHVDVLPDGRIYQIMEYVPGKTLRAYAATRRLTPVEVVGIARPLSEALAAAHQRDVIHRDIKPGNLMICAALPGLRVLDFGISKLDDATRETPGADQMLGTPHYMSPEQFLNPRDVTAATDVYSFGVLLFELLAGVLPFPGSSVTDLRRAHTAESPRDLRALVPAVPGELAELVARCLAKEPSRRPRTSTLVGALAELGARLGARSPTELALQAADTTDVVELGRLTGETVSLVDFGHRIDK